MLNDSDSKIDLGTGLGLYLSQQIVKSHGGEITVQSEENVKTEFCIKLPL